MKKLNQKGFGLWELLLLLLLLILLALFGWWFWQQKQTKDESQPQPNSQASSKEETEQATFLEIKEWGVKIPLTENIKDAEYSYINGYVYLGVKSLTVLDPHCASDEVSLGAIYRQTQEVIEGEQPQVASKKVGNYYYGYSSPQAMCYEEPSDAFDLDQQKNFQAELKKAFDKLQE